MAKANVILLNSILWNLREVTKLTEKIKGCCGDVDCTSWRYPLTSCSELEIFKLLQNNRNLDNYTYILELTYDRLLYLFNLIIKYLESTESLKSFRTNKNVCRPKTLSLAAVLHMIWERIQIRAEGEKPTVLPEKLQGSEPESIMNVTELTASKSSIYTQSEISSITLCSCCEMVQQFVTQLVLEMEKVVEKQNFCSAISNERKLMRENLAEMTTWSAMSKWLSAILKDFTSLIEKIDEVTTHTRKLRTRMESGEKKMKFRAEQQEEELRKLEFRLKDQEVKISDLKEKLEILTSEKATISEQLEQKTSEFLMKIADMKKIHENKLKEQKQKMLKKEKEKELEQKHELEAECAKSKELAEQNGRFEAIISQLSSSIEQANLQAADDKQTWMSKHLNLENEIQRLQQEHTTLQAILEEKEQKINEYKTRLMKAFPELHDVPQSNITVDSHQLQNVPIKNSGLALQLQTSKAASGVPEIDMEYQIEANNYRIDLLISENKKLQTTLDKIKAMKG